MPKRPRRPFFRPYQPPTGFAVRAQHLRKVVDAAEVIAQLRLADLDDQGGRVEGVVAKREVVTRTGWGGQQPRVVR
jgi:hypothetical protein